jgi:hypothetical protein
MTNHIKNKITLTGEIETIGALIDRFGTHHKAQLHIAHDGSVICESVTEKYKFCWLNLSTGLCTSRDGINQIGLPDGYKPEIVDSFFRFPDFLKVIPAPDDPAYRDEPNQDTARHSPNWWYNWNIKHWGTKWNSYSCERTDINAFTFETAWAPVPLIINTISKAFPKITIQYWWADEDTGHNCGHAVYLNGLIHEEIPEGGSNEAYELAFLLHPDRKESYELTDVGYRYKE